MSDLLEKVLRDEIKVDEVVRWLLVNDIAILKENVSQIEFARCLLAFLRRHTYLLLPSQVPLSAINNETPAKSTDTSPTSITTLPDSRSTTPVCTRKTNGSPKARSPFSPTENHSPFPREIQVNSNSIDLLERRLTSKEDSPRNICKTVPLIDFLKHKEKQCKKKRVKLVRCDLNDSSKEIPSMEKTNSLTRVQLLTRSYRNAAVTKQSESVYCEDVNQREDKSINAISPCTSKNQISTLSLKKRVSAVNVKMSESTHNYSMQLPTPACVQVEDSDVEIKDESEIFYEEIKSDHKILILKLASLYSAIITANLVQDLLKELHFLISLLTSSVKVKSVQYTHYCLYQSVEKFFHPNTKDICLFKIKAEGMYFASVTLFEQWDILKYLDKSTISLLSQNKLIAFFVPEFAARIRDFIEKSKLSHRHVNILDREMLSETVKFKMDTDCRSNYVNDQSFCAFKKQRDEFYSLLQDWESNQRPSPAEFLKARQKRLRPIFTSSTASANMFRLANLFVSQILASVFNENFESCENLSQAGVALTKFDNLNRRFVTPSSIVVGNDKRFPGVQEFFIEFLRFSENVSFLSHVRDVLVQRIISLDGSNFSNDISVALERQEMFLVCINKLCLLAKFLSWINFLPYHDKDNLPLHLRIPLADVRKHVLPPFDLEGILTNAINTGRMLITVPWIVEFLNGIDETSIHLPCYYVLFVKLQYLLYKIKLPYNSLDVPRNVFLIYSENVKKLLIEANVSPIKINLETNDETKINKISLLEMQEIAIAANHNFLSRFVDECVRTFNCSQILITLYVNSLFNNVSVSTIIKIEEISTLIKSPILITSELYIDDKALYQCCPQLNEIKSLLDCGRKQSYRSVPTRTAKAISERQNNEVAIEMQLEMHFFDNMPHSVKHAVEFVAKQLSSHCENSLRENIIPKIKSELSVCLKSAYIQKMSSDEIMETTLAKFYNILRHGVKDELARLYISIENSLKGILKPDVKEDAHVFNICVNVTCRKCIEITFNWISNYINFNALIDEVKKTVADEVERVKSASGKVIDEKKTKKSKTDVKRHEFDQLVSLKDIATLEKYPSPVKVLHRLRHLTRLAVYDDSSPIGHESTYSVQADPLELECIQNMLEDSIKCVKYRADLQFIAFRRILMLSLDLAYILIFFKPDLVVDSLLLKFSELWIHRKDCGLHLPFEQILSARNVEIYIKVSEKKHPAILRKLSKFVSFTINEKMMHVSRLFKQMLKLLQHEWPNEVQINRIFDCIREVLKECHTSNEKVLTAIESITYIGEEYWNS